MTALPLRARDDNEAAARQHFPVLDTIRAVGALAVVTTHTSFQSGAYGASGIWGTLLARLDVGVAIFFVLSGFLLSRPYLVARARRVPAPDTGRYYLKRLRRIYPVYAVTVVVALLLVPQDDRLGPRDWLRSLLMVDVYAADRLPQGLTQMWSLAVEVAFYFLLPWLMVLALGRQGHADPRRFGAVLGACVALSIWWHLGLNARVDEVAAGMVTTWLPAYLTWFVVGIALAAAHVRTSDATPGRAARALQALGAMPGVCWSAVLGLMLVAATPLAGPALLLLHTPAEALTKHLLYALVGGLVVLTGVFPADGGYRRVMSAAPLRHLGLISYSIFCIHLPVLHLVMEVTGYELFEGHGLQIWVATVVVSLLASELLYRFVELPGMRLHLKRRGASSANQPSTTEQANSTR